MKLIECILTKNDCYKAGKKITPKGIMVHSTGANNPYIKRYVQPNVGGIGTNNNGNHWNQSGIKKCVHAFIGKLEGGSIATAQTLPWNHRAWHCGSGRNGSANNTHISFEICEDGLTDKSYFTKVYQEAVELCAYLCKQYKLDPLKDGVIICHSEGAARGIASNHGDVMHWFPKHGKTMNDFRNDVANAMKEDEPVTQEQFDKMLDNWLDRQSKLAPGNWSAADRKWAEDNGILLGSSNGKMYQSFCTREQMVAFLHRLANLLDN